MPENTGSGIGYIGMGQYLIAIAAGHAAQTRKIGFVAAETIPQLLVGIASFLLGARAVDPSIQRQVIFTGKWSMAVKKTEAAHARIIGGGFAVIAGSLEDKSGNTVAEAGKPQEETGVARASSSRPRRMAGAADISGPVGPSRV